MIEIEKPKIETEILSEDGTHGKLMVLFMSFLPYRV